MIKYPLNPDLNSGNPIGLSVTPESAYKGVRTTAADFLLDPPDNLHILTNTQVARVLFSPNDPTTAIGIETLDGLQISATHDVILSSGSIDTPKVLLLSGIGPSEQLKELGIPVRLDLPFVGKSMKDHPHTTCTWVRAPHTTNRHTYYQSKDLQAAARKQWNIDQTGPLSEISCAHGGGFFKNEAVYQSEEFLALPKDRQRHLQQETVPLYEVYLNGPSKDQLMSPATAQPLTTIFLIILTTEDSGEVKLQTSDPKVPPLCDPKFFSHPFGRRVAIEATREVLHVSQSEVFQKDTVSLLDGPKSLSDEDIWQYWQDTTSSAWHMAGTVSMGKYEEEGTCVDSDFRVIGTKGLRVVDLSVIPISPRSVIPRFSWNIN